VHGIVFIFIFATKFQKEMKTQEEYISILKDNSEDLYQRFGIRYLCMFGSVAKNKHTENSDIDLFVEMPSDFNEFCYVADYLESLLGCPVDLIRRHDNMRPFFLNQIQKYGIDIYRRA